MGPLTGFITVPRLADAPRPMGAFFSAVVEAKVGADTWRVKLDGQSLVVTTTLELVPGQTLRLKTSVQQGTQWILQTVGSDRHMEVPENSPLMAAFLSRGLPLAAETLVAWSRWLGRVPGPVDRETWAASLEARGVGPSDPLTSQLQPWLTWQTAMEAGRNPPPPDNPDWWDLWNTRKTPSGDSWLVQPLRWEFDGREDYVLLQAHFNPQRQMIDRWIMTASPNGFGFRLDALCDKGRLDLTWHFFYEADRLLWSEKILGWNQSLSSPELAVNLKVSGSPEAPFLVPRGRIDVEA